MTLKHFENTSFIVDATEEPGCLLSLKIFVKPEESKKIHKKAVKLVNKQVSVPGFRKGHAPDATVISRYNSYVEREWKDLLLNEAYRGAADLIKIYPFNKDSFRKPRVESASLDEGSVVYIAYEYYPQIPLIDFTSISLPTIEKEAVTEEAVETVLNEVRKAHALWEDADHNAVQLGDFVEVTIHALDEEPPKPIVTNRRLEVNDQQMAHWLTKLLLNRSVGDIFEGVTEIEEQASETAKANFKPSKVKIELHSIKKMLLPEANEELVKKTGADSLDDLLKKIRLQLEKEKENEQKSKQLYSLDTILLEKYPFELPQSLVASEREERVKEKIRSLKAENISDEEIKHKRTEIEQEVNREIDRDLRLFFLNKQIAKQGNISLTTKELNDEIALQVSRNPYLYGGKMDSETSKEFVSKIASILIQRKTKDWALNQVLEHA